MLFGNKSVWRMAGGYLLPLLLIDFSPVQIARMPAVPGLITFPLQREYLPNCVEARRRRVRIRIVCTGARLQAVAVVLAAKRIAGEPLRCAFVSHTNRLGSRTTASRTTCRHLPVVPIRRVAFISASRIPYQKRGMVMVTGNRTGFLFNCIN